MPEWDRLLDLAGEVGADVEIVRPSPGARVLTDDDAPLEHLTDRFVAGEERRLLGGRGDAAETRYRDRLRTLSRKQDRMLAGVAAAWAAVLLAAFLTVRRA